MTLRLSDAADTYVAYRRATYGKATAMASRQSLDQFMALVGNLPVKSLSPSHAERFQMHLLGEAKAPNTVNSRMSQLSCFSKWALAHRHIPAHFVIARTIPVPERARLRVPVAEFPTLLEAAERPDRRIIIALGLYLFLRNGELRTLRVRDVDLDEGILSVVVHKTKKFDEMPIVAELDYELRRWFAAYQRDIGRPLRGSDYLVPAHRRAAGWLPRPETGNYQPERISCRPYHQVQAVLDACGYPVLEEGKKLGEGCHTLRRSGARALFDSLVEGEHGAARDDALRITMACLHHQSIKTTETYLGLEVDRKKRDSVLRGKQMFGQAKPILAVAQ